VLYMKTGPTPVQLPQLASEAERSLTASKPTAASHGNPTKWIVTALLLAIALLAQTRLHSATFADSGFIETAIGGTWTEAVGLLFEDNGRMYVWERAGRVWIMENGVKLPTPLIDINDEVGGWRDFGLLGFALDPNFRNNGYIYLLYVVDHYYLANFGKPGYNTSSNDYYRATIGRITRYTANAADGFKSVNLSSRKILLGESISNGIPILHESHGVGTLLFGTDGTLLVSCGDGASYSSTDTGSASETYYAAALSEGIIKPKENVGAYRAQMVDSHNGKILRLDPATGDGIPSNPFYDSANPRAPRSRVWALGLRNPCRMTLKPNTGSHNRANGNPGVIYIGDVGWNTWEDLNVSTGPGKNFGWPAFEGLEVNSSYYNANIYNQDAPNPLYGTGGCTQQYFYFRDLIRQTSLNTVLFPNPCNSGIQVPATIPHFVHTRPALDWKHSTGPSRTGIYDGSGNAAVINIGAIGSPVTGPQFPGNCSIGGVWYTNTDFPAQYRNTYFHADYGANWIRSFTFDQNDKPLSVRDFLTAGGGIVDVAADPKNGGLYYLSWTSVLRKISYVASGNQPPTAVASSDKTYGPGPLNVQFNGSASTDPEGLALTYNWNFGDGSATSSQANPQHNFNAPAGVPTEYVVTLAVTDNGGATSVDSLIISLNNTPPVVTITSPIDGSLYSMSGDTIYNLTANVTDAEQTDDQLTYQWQTILHHNNHEHPEPIDTNHVTTSVISPAGCDGNTYYYRIILTVTDAAGLSTSAEVDLYPNCGNQAPLASFTANPTNGASPLLVSFDARPTIDPDGDAMTFSWDFGDTTSGTGLTPTHSYGTPGTYNVILTVTDSHGLAATTSHTISVNAPPTISSIANKVTSEDTATAPINFTVGDAETPATALTVSGSSGNLTLVPNANISFGGSGANRTVTVTPAANQSGTATITVTVNDGSATASTAFVLTVNPVNDAPTISNIADQNTPRNTATPPIAFTIGDLETPASNLIVTGSSSDQTIVPNANIIFGGSGANRTVTLTPAANISGTTTMTITVSDGVATAIDTFVLTVNPPFAGVKINFQPSGVPIPAGYLPDTGLPYANRGNGYSYGWDKNNNFSKDRNSSLSPDQRYDTTIQMQKGGSRTWEIGLPNGTYTVFVVAGDAGAFDSTYAINVEGVLTVNGTPTSATRWISGTKTVTVTDGRLTLSNGSGANNNKVCFIDISAP